MGVRKDDLTQYIQQLETLKADIPAIMSKIAAGEGAYAVKQARLICKNDNVINTGAYRRNWQSDKTAKRSGRRYIVRFYNPLDYASHLSMDFGATLCRATGRAIPLFMAAMIPKAACMSARRADTCGGILC
ncbi:MAG: HK97 gp10 family phage protein [Oscillospiraceae bacterium]